MPESVVVEMQKMKHFLCSVLQKYYGQVCAFEHGPSRANLKVGCGVDHAHLHIVPIAFDLASAVTPFLPEDVFWSKAGMNECRTAFARGGDYLYLEQPIGNGRIITHQEFGSQLFRRAIATQIGAMHQFNWREYPHLPNISATIGKVRKWDEGVFSWMSRPKAAAWISPRGWRILRRDPTDRPKTWGVALNIHGSWSQKGYQSWGHI